jgi:hypothetical protein
MFPNDVIARERIADRIREGEHERHGRQTAHARAVARRAKVRGALNLVVGHFALARRRRVVRPA